MSEEKDKKETTIVGGLVYFNKVAVDQRLMEEKRRDDDKCSCGRADKMPFSKTCFNCITPPVKERDPRLLEVSERRDTFVENIMNPHLLSGGGED